MCGHRTIAATLLYAERSMIQQCSTQSGFRALNGPFIEEAGVYSCLQGRLEVEPMVVCDDGNSGCSVR